MVYMDAMTMTTAPIVVVKGADGVRAYLRTLRQRRKVSQRALAIEIGLSRRALIDYEMGRTAEIKSGPLGRALKRLDGDPSHVIRLIREDANEARGRELAESLFTPAQIARVDQAIATTPPEELDAVLSELRAELHRDPALLTYLRGLLNGWRGRGGTPRP